MHDVDRKSRIRTGKEEPGTGLDTCTGGEGRTDMGRTKGDRSTREAPGAETGATCLRSEMVQTTLRETGKLELRKLPGHIRFNVNERIRMGQDRIHVYEVQGVFGGWIVSATKRKASEDEDLVLTVEVQRKAG